MPERQLTALIAPLLDLCRDAGDAICAHYEAPGASQFQSKEDDSPLTRADVASHDLLLAGLRAMQPGWPVLSEESSAQEKSRRHGWPRYWLVDPLDGTREFLARTGEFTVNIALVDEHRPILGMLYVPLQQQAFVGIPGRGAWQYSAAAGGWQRAPLATRKLQPGSPLLVLASRRHGGAHFDDCLAWLGEHWGTIERRNSGSALKFCQLAAGEGDFYPRFAPCCEWDTAAGQALLEAAGGALVGLDGQPLAYNCRDTLLNPDFYAIADAGHALWRHLLKPGG